MEWWVELECLFHWILMFYPSDYDTSSIDSENHFIQKISKKSLLKKDLSEVERFMQMLNKPEQIAHLPGKDGLERQ